MIRRPPGDAAQRTLLAACSDLRTDSLVHGAPRRRWLGSVLRNFLRQAHRGAERRSDYETRAFAPEVGRSSFEVAARLEMQRRVVDAVEALDEPYRTTITFRFLEGLSPHEVARRMDVPVKTVHTRVDRALTRLRSRLDEAYDGRQAWMAILLPIASGARVAGAAGLGVVVMTSTWKTIGVAASVVLAGVLLQRMLDGDEAAPSSARAAGEELSPPAEAVAVTETAQPVTPPSEDESRRAVTAPPQRPQEAVALETVDRFRGRIVDVNDRPVANLRVTFEPTTYVDRELTETETSARSDSGGWFEMDYVRFRGRLVVRDGGYASVISPGIAAPPPVPPIVVVAPERHYSGRVVDTEGEALSDAELEIVLSVEVAERFRPGSLDHGLPAARTTSDADGTFAFESVGFAVGSTLAVRREGFGGKTDVLPAESTTDLVIELERIREEGKTVAGFVVDADLLPVEGASVSLGQRMTRTDVEGAFVLELGGNERNDVLRAVVAGRLPAEATLSELSLAEQQEVVLSIGDEALAITGCVVDSAGEPVVNAEVWTPDGDTFGFIEREFGETSFFNDVDVEEMIGGGDFDGRQDHTDASGAFALSGLVDRDYDLYAMDPVTLVATVLPVVPAGSDRVTLHLNGGESTARVAGRVVTSTGQPVSTAFIRVWRRVPAPDGSRVFRGADYTFGASSDDDGRFEFPSLALDHTHLVLNGENIPSAQSRALTDVSDLEQILFIVPESCHVRIWLESDPAMADAFALVDEYGDTLNLSFMHGSVTLGAEVIGLDGGASPLTQTDDSVRAIVLYKDDEEVSRIPVALLPGEVNEVRL